MMRHIRSIASTLIIFSWFAGVTSAFSAEVIHSFDSSVRVAKDGELIVTDRKSVV